MTKVEELQQQIKDIKAAMLDEESKAMLKEPLAEAEKQLAEAQKSETGQKSDNSDKPKVKPDAKKKTLVRKKTKTGQKTISKKTAKAESEKKENEEILKAAKARAEKDGKGKDSAELKDAIKKAVVNIGKNKYRLKKLSKNATKSQIKSAETKAARNRRIVKTKTEQIINASLHDVASTPKERKQKSEVIKRAEKLKKAMALVMLETDETIKSEDLGFIDTWTNLFVKLLKEGLKNADTNKWAHIDYAPQFLVDLGIAKNIEAAKKFSLGGSVKE